MYLFRSIPSLSNSLKADSNSETVISPSPFLSSFENTLFMKSVDILTVET